MARKLLTLTLGMAMGSMAAAMQPVPVDAGTYVYVQETAPAAPATPSAKPAKPEKSEKPDRPEKAEKPRTAVAPMARAFAVAGGTGSYLGIDIKDVTSDRMSALKLKEERGCEIVTVDQDAPAGKAGLKEQDVILDFNGQRVESEESLRRMLRETPPGRTVALGISRDGMPQTIKVTLGDRKQMSRSWTVIGPGSTAKAPKVITIPDVDFRMPDIEIPQIEMVVRSTVGAGMMIDNLTPQLGEFFGVKGGEGVLVRSVEKGSAAEAAGVKAGDVIIKINDERISDRTDLRRSLRSAKGKTNITVVRDKREQVLSINLSGKTDSSFKFDYDFDNDFDIDVNAMDFSEFESSIRQQIRNMDPELETSIAAQRVANAKKAALELQKIRRSKEDAERAKRLMMEMQLRFENSGLFGRG